MSQPASPETKQGTAVLLIAFGGPECMEDVKPFLENVLRGRPIPQKRFDEVVDHYRQLGGRSPLNAQTRAQASALERALQARGHTLPVSVGMRNWHPFIEDSLRTLMASGTQRVIAMIMAAHATEASDARYKSSVDAALNAMGSRAPQVAYTEGFGSTRGFIEANACHVAQVLAQVDERERAETPLLFSAHSIPVAMAEASPYVSQIEQTAGSVAEAVGHPRWRLCYQSRSGSPRDPWLEPDVNVVLEQEYAAGARCVVVSPIGFVSDHIEVRYDLDVEAQATAQRLGLRLLRAKAANAHRTFIEALADRVEAALPTSSSGETPALESPPR